MGAWWTVIVRAPQYPIGKWHHTTDVFETREQAVKYAADQWDGTGVQWRLMTIPQDDDE